MLFAEAEKAVINGYSLMVGARANYRINEVFITLNTSLSGSFNEAMVK